MDSNFLKLDIKDLAKGFLLAVFTAVLTGLYTTIQSGVFPDWPQLKQMLLAGLLAGIAYLCKNLLTNSSGVPLTPEK